MSAKPHTPTAEDFVNLFAASTEGGFLAMSNRAKTARRGIAKVRADALREFADEWGDGNEGFPFWPLHDRADEIEETA